MMSKNLKHGLKVYKRDVVLSTRYRVLCMYQNPQSFDTKLDAVNYITSLIYKGVDSSQIFLERVQALKY